jgi:hypothetical protein
LVRLLSSDYAKIKNKRTNLKKQIKNNYTISSDDFNKSNIDEEILNLDEKELDEVSKSNTKTKNFLKDKTNYESNKIEEENLTNFLSDFDIKQEYEKLSQEGKDKLHSFYDVSAD